MSNYYIGINKCPLCSSKERKKFNYSKQNLYSECLSKKLNINEKKLIKIFLNYKCKECSLIYKKNWFKDHVLYDLFQNLVPIHQEHQAQKNSRTTGVAEKQNGILLGP